MGKSLLMISICMILLSTGCGAPAPAAVLQTPTPAAIPTTPTPPASSPTPSPTTEPTHEATSMITPNPNLQTKDLSSFVDAWNSRDVQSISALYSEQARIMSEIELDKLERQTPVEINISDELIAGYLQSIPQSMKLRVIGEPLMVFDKLVAYTYRIEGETDGYNAAGLLRYEGDKIYQHVFLVSDKLTSNAATNKDPLLEAPIGQMLQAWLESDLQTASTVYSDDAIILSDEDIAQAKWRDFQTPPSLDQLFKQFSGWKPELDSPLVQLGDMVIFA